MLYRLFPWDPTAKAEVIGGPRFNPRAQQGSGRHDNPALYGAIYVSRLPISPIAEWLARFRGQTVESSDLVRVDGRRLAVVGFADLAPDEAIELDEPRELAARGLRPSGVATYQRTVTQRLAADLYAEELSGFAWWSTLEASWSNMTLFAERSLSRLTIDRAPRPLTIDDPDLREAAKAVGVRIA